jgi:hypothetical protein
VARRFWWARRLEALDRRSAQLAVAQSLPAELTTRHQPCASPCRTEEVPMGVFVIVVIMAGLSFLYVKKRRARKAAQ